MVSVKTWVAIVAVLLCASFAFAADQSSDLGEKGVTAFKQGDYDKAIDDFSRAVRLNTNYVGAYYFRGLAYMAKSQYDNSISDFSRALALNTNYADAYYFRGLCYMNEKQYNRSLADLSQSLVLKTNITTLMLRAYVYSCVTDYNNSIEDYTKVIHLDPANFRAYLGRARGFILDGAFGLAVMDCNAALNINPNSVSAYQERGQAYQEENDLDDAIADYDRAIQLNTSDIITYYARGTALVSQQRFADAIPDFDKFIASDTNDPSAYSNRGWCKDETGDYAGALRDYQLAVAADTNSAFGYNNLAWELSVCPDGKFRNGPRAVGYAKKACDLTGWTNAMYLDTLAAAYAESGNFRKAVHWEKKAIKGLADKDLSEGQKALSLYEHRKPYHESPKPQTL